jgi:chromosome segregation protein
MQLKRLELQGFKSFADRTSFDFDKGVTAFVGPNGCGKSNIVDAFRWILGEQSAKAVRGTQMMDVIFNGTSARRSLSYAEASLTIENNKGILPTDYSEVCITRRLYRSGESEYLMNRQPCRLRDIRQLFLDTGVGMNTYSIIEQGKVDAFIAANAHQRRQIIEEAAGISRYKAQRKEAQNRLERARGNLAKVDIKLEEQRKQLRSIKYQAAKARRFRRQSGRLRNLVVSFSARNYRAWETERSELEEQIAALIAQETALATSLQELEAALQKADEQMVEIEQASREKQDERHRIDAATDAAQATILHSRERITEYQEETELCSQAVWTQSEKLRQTQESIEAAARDLEHIHDMIQRQAERIARETEKADVAGAECSRLTAAIEEWKNRTIQVIEQATTLRNELNHMERNQREQLARRSRIAGQLEEKQQETGRIDSDIGSLAGQRDEISGRLADRSSLLHEKDGELKKLSEHSDTLQDRLRGLHQRGAQCLSRREILQDIEMRSEDVESGVKRLLRQEEGDGDLRIMGMVADLIHVELEYAAAIESALGEAAQYLVTQDKQDAGAAAALLRTDRAGRAGLIPVNHARADQPSGLHLLTSPGVMAHASDVVRYSAEIEPVVRHLLGDTWIVKNLDTAMALSGEGGSGLRFVTMDGERVDPSGAIIGGEPLPRIGIVSRKSELEAIEKELVDLDAETTGLESERGRIDEHISALTSEVSTLRKEIEQGNLDKLTNENEILNLRKRQKILTEEIILLNSEIAEIDETLRGYEDRRNAIAEEVEETQRQHDALQAEVETARRSLAEQQSAAARLREDVTQLKVELADKEARRGSLEDSINAAKTALQEIEEQIVATRRRMEEIQQRENEAAAAIAKAEEEMATLARDREALQVEISRLAQALDEARTHRADCVQKTRTVRLEQDDVRGRLQNRQLQAQELRVRMEGLAESVFNEHGIQLAEFDMDPVALLHEATSGDAPDTNEEETEEAAPSEEQAEAEPVNTGDVPVEAVAEAPVYEEPDWDAIDAEIRELREKIRRMGGINEEAINEEEGLSMIINETEAHREDLVKAEAQLREVIRKLNRVCRERFAKTFEEVRKNFLVTFRRLFGGGKADLILDENEPDMLEAGIDVLACPPGKEMRSITLLSGGEKTMTTIALLFAIFKSKPSPFCILDEVDAALDEANIDRFTSMLNEFLGDSQFIIITHSKRTIGIADVLYGITMQEKGVSKNVAVSLDGTEVLNN